MANKPKSSYINQQAVIHLLREEYEEVKDLLDNPSFQKITLIWEWQNFF
ncbi:hypothetical protein [Marinitoga lauensis]|nr:hypothetical protein [Marinitoga lauensis]